MNKKYIAPKQLIINLDATESLLANSDTLQSDLGELPEVDNYDGENQFSRNEGNVWDREW